MAIETISEESILRIERKWAMPNKRTFQIHPIKEFLGEEVSDGIWIDPFANESNWATITNDLNQKFNTDYHMDALEFMKLFESDSIDGVLFDPPYSPRQVKECYESIGLSLTQETTQTRFWSRVKDEIARVVKPGGKAICFGWNSQGIGINRGFVMNRILMVAHGSYRNDTICVVETKKIM